jgi:hypothetical protein
MTRRNDKRNNRLNRQRSNNSELNPFAQMLFGALLGKGVDMIAKKMAENAEEETPDVKDGNPITYEDVLKELFLNKNAYWVNGKDDIRKGKQDDVCYKDAINCTALAQVKRLVAFNKLQNIAKYLNGDWKPDFDGDHENWCIIKEDNNSITLYTRVQNTASVYFKSAKLANEAIEIMGKESLNDLFSTDW